MRKGSTCEAILIAKTMWVTALMKRVRALFALLWLRMVWFFAGPDIFITYSRWDGAAYASALASRLSEREADLHCFLDQWDSPPDPSIPERVHRALRRATMLVVVGSTGAARSRAVFEEICGFRRVNWRIVPISIEGAVESAPWFSLVDGLARETEGVEALASGMPSDRIIRRIKNSFQYSRRNRRVRRGFAWAATAIVVLMAISVAVTLQ